MALSLNQIVQCQCAIEARINPSGETAAKRKEPSADKLNMDAVFSETIVPFFHAKRERKPEEEIGALRRSYEKDVGFLKRKIRSARGERRHMFQDVLNEVKAAMLIADSDTFLSRDDALQQVQQMR